MDNKIPHILIVDDDPNLLGTMRDILKMKGFEPVIASTGAAALAQLEQHHFDLALIDLRLDDMSGLLILRAIKTHSPETECILLTGHASQDTAIEAIQMGVYGYFQKPFDMEQVLLSIQRALEKSAAARALQESERFAYATVDALSSHLAILDETGAILAVNRAWREFAVANSEGKTDFTLCEGANYLTVCDTAKGKDSEEASAMAAGIRAVMSGEKNEFLLEYPCHSLNGERWFTARVTRFPGAGVLRIVVAHENITERKQAEIALLDSEKRFRALIENGRDNISLLTADGTLLWESPSTKSTLGYAPDQFVGHGMFELLHPDDREKTLDLYAQLVQTPGKSRDDIFRLRHSDGTWRWIESTTTNLLNEPSVRAIIINYRDISERIQAEEKIAQTEKRFRSLIENAPDGVVLVGLDGKYKYASPAALRVFNYSMEDALDSNPNEQTHPEDLPMVLGVLQDIIENPTKVPTIQYRFLHKDGSWRWVESTFTNLLAEPGVEAIVINFRDVTESKQALNAQQESDLRFRALFDLSPDAVILIDPHDPHISWPIIDCNEAACQMNGYHRDELIGHSIDIVNTTPGAQAERNAYLNRLREMGNIKLETFHRHKNGTVFPIEVSTSTIMVGNRELLIGIDRDITQRKQAELALGESQRRLTTLMANLPGMAFRCKNDLEWSMEFVSEGCIPLTGYHPAEMINNAGIAYYGQIIHTEDRQMVSDAIQAKLEKKQPYQLNYRITTASGQERWVWEQGQGVYEAGGSLLALEGFISDITERKRAEDELRQSEQRFQQLANNIQEAFWITEAGSGREIYISPAAEKVWGISVPDLYQGKYLFLESILPEDRQIALNAIERQSHGAKTEMEYRIQHPDGSIRWIWDRAFPVLDEAGKVLFVTGLAADITERKRIGKALQESEQKYRLLFDEMLSGVAVHEIICDKQGTPIDYRFIAINTAFEKMTGLVAAEVIGKTVLEMMPATESHWIEVYGQVALTRVPTQFENYSSELGKYFDVRAFSPEQGKFATIFNDITERKQAEERLVASETRYRRLFEASRDGILILEADTGIVLNVNPFLVEMLGIAQEEILGKELWELGFFKDIAANKANFRELQHNEYIRYDDLPLETAHGRRFNVEFVSNVYQVNRHMVVQCNIRDITERKQVEQNIGQRVKELELLYQSGLVFSQMLNPKQIAQKIIDLLGEKLDWHHTTIRLLRSQDELELVAFDQPGLEDKETIETHFNNLITHVGQGLSGWALQQSKTIRLGDVNNDPHYVATFPGLHSGLYVPLKSGNQVLGVISIESEQPDAFSEADEQLLTTLANQAANAFENARLYQTAQQEITERKRVENLLAEEKNQLAHRVEERTSDLSRVNADLAHALRVKDEFLASMSHELRTPLTGILGLSEVLQLKIYGELNDKQAKTLKTIEESGRHLLELINDILDLSKIEAGKLELQFAPCSLADICQASLQLIKGMAQHKGQHVYYDPPTQPIIVRADARRLKQLLVNLLSNAIKFTPENGDLGLEIETFESERKLKVTVWDKGIGIKPDDLQNIFKPFVQLDSGLAREYSGTGLGLSLVHHLTELHNGGIEVESKIGEGSRFTIVLPWSPKDTTPIPYPHLPQRAVTGRLSLTPNKDSTWPLVMYVDDNEMVLQMVSDFLETKQYRVIKVRNGIELLEQAAESHPDIMLVDIQMPGIGGLETISRIRAHSDPLVAAAPIIAVTALAMSTDRERCLRAGANDYMSKPLKLKDLALAIRKLLDERNQ